MPYVPPPSRGADNFDSTNFGQAETARRLTQWHQRRAFDAEIEASQKEMHERAKGRHARVISRGIR